MDAEPRLKLVACLGDWRHVHWIEYLYFVRFSLGEVVREAMPLDEEELYQEHILDHYEDPFHRGQLPSATHSHEDKNPLCGDVVRIDLQLDDSGKIVDCYFGGEGCVISQASASMLLEKIYGKTVDEVKQFSAEDMLTLYGARLTPNRQKCCLLSWKVLQSAVHSPVNGTEK